MSNKTRKQRAKERPCDVFWGSHGCHKQLGHSGIHFCEKGCTVVSNDLSSWRVSVIDEWTPGIRTFGDHVSFYRRRAIAHLHAEIKAKIAETKIAEHHFHFHFQWRTG